MSEAIKCARKRASAANGIRGIMRIKRTVIPVLLGGGAAAYYAARAFYDAFGVTSYVMATARDPFVNADFIRLNICKDLRNIGTAASVLLSFAAENTGAELHLLASSDEFYPIYAAVCGVVRGIYKSSSPSLYTYRRLREIGGTADALESLGIVAALKDREHERTLCCFSDAHSRVVCASYTECGAEVEALPSRIVLDSTAEALISLLTRLGFSGASCFKLGRSARDISFSTDQAAISRGFGALGVNSASLIIASDRGESLLGMSKMY